MSYVEGSVVFRRLEQQIDVEEDNISAAMAANEELVTVDENPFEELAPGDFSNDEDSNLLLYEAMGKRKKAMETVLGKKHTDNAASRKQGGSRNKTKEKLGKAMIKEGTRRLSHRPGQDGMEPSVIRARLGQIEARLTPAFSRRKVERVAVSS